MPIRKGNYLLLFDPLDGSSNIDVNVSVGTIFSVLRCPDGVIEPGDEHFLQPGTAQVAPVTRIYGPSTMLVLTIGHGTHGFTLDREQGSFVLTRRDMRIPADTQEFAINMSNQRHWEAPMQRYVDDLLAGKHGPRGKDFNMRWVASMVADVHRILTRGGIFIYPVDRKDPSKAGRLRLMYEANPMAFIVEQAGGAATTGRERMLERAADAAAPARAGVPGLAGTRWRSPRAITWKATRPRAEPCSAAVAAAPAVRAPNTSPTRPEATGRPSLPRAAGTRTYVNAVTIRGRRQHSRGTQTCLWKPC